MENSPTNIITTITQVINSIFNNFFSSVDNNLYAILDDLTFINEDILSDIHFQQLLGISAFNGILLIANSLVIGFLIYYAIKFFFSSFGSFQIQNPYQFLFKLIILTFFMNFSFFLCEQIILIISYLTLAIRNLGENLYNTNISFSGLIQNLNSTLYISDNSYDIFSVNGLIKSIISTSLFSLVISYSLRYILIKVFILILPFAFLSLSTPSTSFFFTSWLKSFLSLLLVQILISIILLIIFSITLTSSSLTSKFLCCGGIFALIKANSYVKEFLGGISSTLNTGINNIKNFSKF